MHPHNPFNIEWQSVAKCHDASRQNTQTVQQLFSINLWWEGGTEGQRSLGNKKFNEEMHPLNLLLFHHEGPRGKDSKEMIAFMRNTKIWNPK